MSFFMILLTATSSLLKPKQLSTLTFISFTGFYFLYPFLEEQNVFYEKFFLWKLQTEQNFVFLNFEKWPRNAS